MPAPKGNKFWKARSSHGRKPLFETPEALWNACCEYFEWVEKHPLWESKAFAFQGTVTVEKLPKMRAMTLTALRLFLDIDRSTWEAYRTREDYTAVTTRVEDIIYSQKLEGAAADLLNANIIARDLGLRDKQEHDIGDTLAALVASSMKNSDD
ncbi:hypothetical protein FHT86_002164 [Rhizobium sp. BK313]|uniref:DNA-packaging protein n=1 Tax=Rhizobium sp. BK313 TaxID=2587081 RepID=UPI0016198941|nr:DNA-packaging protein [Rhizobium sp. BK313]MBB3453908.1 hypothetical protein [Rhizobium sp. BK313]